MSYKATHPVLELLVLEVSRLATSRDLELSESRHPGSSRGGGPGGGFSGAAGKGRQHPVGWREEQVLSLAYRRKASISRGPHSGRGR